MNSKFAALFVLLGTVLLSGADAGKLPADSQEMEPIQQQLRGALSGMTMYLRETLVPLLDRMTELSKRYSADVQELVLAARPHAERAMLLAQGGVRDASAYAKTVLQEARERGPVVVTQAQQFFQQIVEQVQDNKEFQKTKKYLEQMRQQ